MKRSDRLAILQASIPAKVSCSTGPCRHDSACCNWGTTLSDREVAAIRERFPDHEKLVVKKHGEMRTRVRNGVCVFKKDNGCVIHDEPFYPVVCRLFPWESSTGGPYTDAPDE
jgi:hypothetical protein